MTFFEPGTLYQGSDIARPPAEARGLSALRALPAGAARQYSAVEWDRWNGVEHFIRTLMTIGYIRASTTRTDGYAVLDVLNTDGDIIADYDIPTATAFRYIKRKLKLTVVDTETAEAGHQSGATR